MLGSLKSLAEASAEGLAPKPSLSLLAGLCVTLAIRAPFLIHLFTLKRRTMAFSLQHPSCTPLAHRKMEAWRSFLGGVWICVQLSVAPACVL